jgi:hypothetical protein
VDRFVNFRDTGRREDNLPVREGFQLFIVVHDLLTLAKTGRDYIFGL